MAIINDGIVEKWWQEPGINNDGSDDDLILRQHQKIVLNISQKINRQNFIQYKSLNVF